MAISVTNPKVICVHEIGHSEINHFTDSGLSYVVCGEHFIKNQSPIKRKILTTSIKMIENFELPIYKFKKFLVRKWLFFVREILSYRKEDTARGCVITFLDGSRMFVKEAESEVECMIENR